MFHIIEISTTILIDPNGKIIKYYFIGEKIEFLEIMNGTKWEWKKFEWKIEDPAWVLNFVIVFLDQSLADHEKWIRFRRNGWGV